MLIRILHDTGTEMSEAYGSSILSIVGNSSSSACKAGDQFLPVLLGRYLYRVLLSWQDKPWFLTILAPPFLDTCKMKPWACE